MSKEGKKRNYFHNVADHQHDPGGMLYDREPTLAALEELDGATSITPADQRHSHQVGNQPLYVAATTPRNKKEVPHFHGGAERPVEAYLVTEGEALVWVRWAWETSTPWRKIKVRDALFI